MSVYTAISFNKWQVLVCRMMSANQHTLTSRTVHAGLDPTLK